MRFGLFGGAAAKQTDETSDNQLYGEFVDYVCEAEQLGFHSVFLVEHHFTGMAQVSAPLALLTYLAARTRRIRLGTPVTVLTWHNPVLLAEQAATLDLLSAGRLDFGIGRGYRQNEFRGFCVPIEEANERYREARIDEIVRRVVDRSQPEVHSPRGTTGASSTEMAPVVVLMTWERRGIR